MPGDSERNLGALVGLLELAQQSEQGNHEQVLARVEELLAELETEDDEIAASGRASIASYGGNSSMELGRPGDALRFAEIELEAAVAAGNSATLRARGLNMRAIAREALGRLAEATADYEEALRALEGVSDSDDSQAGAMRRLISYHLAHLRGTRDESAEGMSELILDAALAHDAPGPLRSTQLAALNARAWAMSMRGDHEGALEILERARRDHPDADDRFAGVLASNIGMEHFASGRVDDAVRELLAARVLHARGGCHAELAMDCFNLAAITAGSRGALEDSAAYLAEAWNALRTGEIRSILTVKVLGALAVTRLLQGDRRRSRAAAEKALDVYEGLRPELAQEEAEHAGPLTAYRQVLETLLFLAVAEGWFSDAIALIERGKGRFWYEEVARRRGRAAEAGLGIDGLEAWRGGWEMHVKDVAGHDTVVLSFLTGPERVFRVVSLNGRSQVTRLDVDMERLQALVDEARYDCMASSSRESASDEGLRELAGLLLGRISFPLDRSRLTIVLPDGPLWAAPLDALPVPEDPATTLADVAPLEVAPSLQILHALQDRVGAGERRWRPLVVADPDVNDLPPLPGARRQLETVREALPRRARAVYLDGRRATKPRVLAALEEATHIHFATHALAGMDEELSHLLLSDGRGGRDPLYAEDVQSLDLHADIVFLSACGTSIGRASTGEGMASLARAFLFAGARCVIATLWPVPDEEAAELTRLFYAELADGRRGARALREARLSARAGGASPRTWASLQLVGDGDSAHERTYGALEQVAWRS
jgi:CHAT domain-containing protein/tetratricopeptide (TPR) repeat protein